MNRKGILAAALCWLLGSSLGLAQQLRVKVISADKGSAISDRDVSIEPVNEEGGSPAGSPQAVSAHWRLAAKTGPDGVAKFLLSSPLPKRVLVSVAIGNWTQCSPLYFSVEEALRTGVVAKNDCESELTKSRSYGVNAGEIVVFTRHIGFWQRVKHFPGLVSLAPVLQPSR